MLKKMFDVLKSSKLMILTLVIIVGVPYLTISLILRNLGQILFGFGSNIVIAIAFIAAIISIAFIISSFINDLLILKSVSKYYDKKVSMIKYFVLYILQIVATYIIIVPFSGLSYRVPSARIFITLMISVITLILYIVINFIICNLSLSKKELQENVKESFNILKASLPELKKFIILYISILVFFVIFVSVTVKTLYLGILPAFQYIGVLLALLIAIAAILSLGIKVVYFGVVSKMDEEAMMMDIMEEEPNMEAEEMIDQEELMMMEEEGKEE